MTTPSYTEDLTDIATGDEASGWVEFTGTIAGEAYSNGGSPTYQDNEYPYIQGSYAVVQTCSKSGANVASLGYSSGGITVPTDGAIFVWHNFTSPFAMDTYANGGFQICAGDSVTVFDIWHVGGRDKESYPYGGFLNHVVNPTVTPDGSAGSPTTLDVIGSAIFYTDGPSKGEPHQCDAMRYGRGSAIFEFGDVTNGYCTIAGFAAANDAQTARWGLIQEAPGGYLWKGRMQLGSATNLVDFRDSNKIIFIQWTPKVTANFNTIEVINASSNIEMTGFQFICLDPSGTASKGRWITTNDATVVLTTCTFSDMSTFVFDSNTTIDTCNFNRCGQITQAGADFDDCNFNESTASIALIVDDPDNIDNCSFTSDGTGYAISLAAATAGNSYTLTGLTVSGYAATDGSTGNEVIYNNSGGTVTLNIDGGSGVANISVHDVSGSTTTLVANYDFTITGLELNTEVTVVTTTTTTVLYHLENATVSDGAGKYKAVYTHSGGATVDVLIHHVDYKPDISNIIGLTLPSVNSTAKVTMFEDENYYNPT